MIATVPPLIGKVRVQLNVRLSCEMFSEVKGLLRDHPGSQGIILATKKLNKLPLSLGLEASKTIVQAISREEEILAPNLGIVYIEIKV